MTRPVVLGTQPFNFGANPLTIPQGANFFIACIAFWGPGSRVSAGVFASSGLTVNEAQDLFVGPPAPEYAGVVAPFYNAFGHVSGRITNRVGQTLNIYNGGSVDRGPIGWVTYLGSVDAIIARAGLPTSVPLESVSLATEADCLFVGFDLGEGAGVDEIENPAGWTSFASVVFNNYKGRARYKDTPNLPTDSFATVVNDVKRVLIAYTLRGETRPILSLPTAVTASGNSATGGVVTETANGTLFYMLSTDAALVDSAVYNSTTTQPVTAAGAQVVNWTGVNTPGTYYAYYGHRNVGNEDALVLRSDPIVITGRRNPYLTDGVVHPFQLGESLASSALSIDVPVGAKLVAVTLDLSRVSSPNTLTSLIGDFCGAFTFITQAQNAVTVGRVVAWALVQSVGAGKTLTPTFAGPNNYIPGFLSVCFLTDVDTTDPFVSVVSIVQSVGGSAPAVATVNSIGESLILVQDTRIDTTGVTYPALGADYTSLLTAATPQSSATTYKSLHRIKKITTPLANVVTATSQNSANSIISAIAFKGKLIIPTGPDLEVPILDGVPTVHSKTNKSVRLLSPAAVDEYGVISYEWSSDNGATFPFTSAGPDYTYTGLSPLLTYLFAVRAADAAGNKSDPIFLSVTTYGEGLSGQEIKDTTGPVSGSRAGILYNDVQLGEEFDWFTFRIITPPATGVLTMFSNGTFVFQGPNLEHFTYMLVKNEVDVPGPELDGSTRVNLYNAPRRRIALFA